MIIFYPVSLFWSMPLRVLSIYKFFPKIFVISDSLARQAGMLLLQHLQSFAFGQKIGQKIWPHFVQLRLCPEGSCPQPGPAQLAQTVDHRFLKLH
jgi:hypothetical protein